ncbi:hypothetical protein VTI74DRAFT_10762 [Chaetomium olivicolor]
MLAQPTLLEAQASTAPICSYAGRYPAVRQIAAMNSSSTLPPPEAVLDAELLAQLNTPEAMALLDTIDSLRDIGVGAIVNLPQIIVVGDQSAGKSSVLEAISRVHFPIDGDLCTRFATELVLRRAHETTVNVSIHFADDARPGAPNGDGPGEPFQRSAFDRDALPDIIREAKERMGIRDDGAKKFSRDILRVEIADPHVYPLTLVDLPGIFHSATADQDQKDKEIVDQLIANYMRQPKSIILAVVAANNQLANQVVLQEAQRHDPSRERTLGVITKPDLAGPGSANERKYLDLARGRESMHRLALGWYVLRNPSEAERSAGDGVRDAVEQGFFRSGAWSAISAANRGVESLRRRLSKVLLDHIKTSLPGLIQDIEANLQTRQEALDRLGKPRSTPEELRSYLLGIAEDFQRLARDGIEGHYSDDKFFGGIDEKETKLRAKLRNRNRAFDAVMSTKAARYKIEWDNDPDEDEDHENENPPAFPEYLQEIIDGFGVDDPEVTLESELIAALQTQASSNLGREFPGEANGQLALQLFKKQAARWQDIAWTHLKQVLKVSQEFVDQAFVHVIGSDVTTLGAVLNSCVDPFVAEREYILRAKLKELLLPYTNGYGLPLEDEFSTRMNRKTLGYHASRLYYHLKDIYPELFQRTPREGLNWSKLEKAVSNLNRAERDQFGATRLLHMMMVYYEMSLRTFVDNVINLAVESCLVRDIPTILTPRKVNAMSIERLTELAAESEEVQNQRLIFQKEVRILRDGLSMCQRYKPRELTAAPTEAPAMTPRRPRISAARSKQTLLTPAVSSRSPTPADKTTPPLKTSTTERQQTTSTNDSRRDRTKDVTTTNSHRSHKKPEKDRRRRSDKYTSESEGSESERDRRRRSNKYTSESEGSESEASTCSSRA